MTPTDDVLAQALKLARTYLGRDDLDGGWFDLGGSSLDAARVVSSLDHDHGWKIALQDLLDAPSVADLLTAPTAAPGAPVSVDALWPALARLPADERLALAHRLLGYVLRESGGQA